MALPLLIASTGGAVEYIAVRRRGRAPKSQREDLDLYLYFDLDLDFVRWEHVYLPRQCKMQGNT